MMTMKKLGKYELLEELGRGGFGTVYRARDITLDVERAVKVLHPALITSPEFIERFRREAKIAARLDDPNIVPVYEFGEVRGAYFLVMKYMPGSSLKDMLVKKGRLTFERAVEITRQIADALEYAYSQPEKLIHRDIKPGNILFEANPLAGTGGAARLADFGFAKALAGVNSSSLSASGGMIGTPPYMPPEVWRHKVFTPATDVYSLACVFYEMITGEILFHGDSPADIMTMHVLDGPQFPEKWPEGVPDGIEGVLNEALVKDPGARYWISNAFVEILERLVKEAPTFDVKEPAEAIEAKTKQREPRRARQANEDESLGADFLSGRHVEDSSLQSELGDQPKSDVPHKRWISRDNVKKWFSAKEFSIFLGITLILFGLVFLIARLGVISSPFPYLGAVVLLVSGTYLLFSKMKLL